MGSVYIELDMKLGFKEPIFIKEAAQFSKVDFTIIEFRKYVIEMIEKILKS